VKKFLKTPFLSIVLVNLPVMAFADSGSPVTEMVVRGATGLALCLAVFAIGVFLMKRTSSKVQGTKREMIIKERVSISAKTNAVLVDIRGTTYLMVSGSESVSITQLPPSDSAMKKDELSVVPTERLFRVGGE
jgi:hypothetical protein